MIFRNILSRAVISPLLAFGIGTLVTVVITLEIGELEYTKSSAEFDRRAAKRATAVQYALEKTVRDLTLVNQFLVTARSVSAEQFQNFTQPILKSNPSVLNFAFHRVLSAAERPAFEAAMRRRFPDFVITEISDGKRIPAGVRDSYRIVEYLSPMKGNEAALGLDAATRQEQKEAWLRACRTGLPSATRPYRLAQLDGDDRGIVVLMPVYRANAELAAPDARCAAVVGYTTVVFSGRALIGSSLDRMDIMHPPGFSTSAYIDDAHIEENLVLRETAAANFVSPFLAELQKNLYRPINHYYRSFDVAGRRWHVIVSPDSTFLLNKHLASLLALAAGLVISALIAAYVRSVGSRSRRIQGMMEERTAELVRLQELSSANRLLDAERSRLVALFEQAPGFIAIIEGTDHVFTMANAAYYRLVGQRELIGKRLRDALPELEGQNVLELCDYVFNAGVPYVARGFPVSFQKEPGAPRETRFVDYVYQPMIDADGRVTGIFVQGNDVSEEKHSQRQLQYLATHDPLTGLPNHALLRHRVEQALMKAKDDAHPVTIIALDLDRYKSINESAGRASGDEVLKVVASRLKSVLRTGDTVARTDGDKFVVVLSGNVTDVECGDVAQRIMKAINKSLVIGEHQFFLTCSIGVATYPADANHCEQLIQHAHLAMNSAKEQGGNNVQFYLPELNHHSRTRLKIASALHGALERSEFGVFYQPQVDLVSGRIVGVEALIRWKHPEMGMVSPTTFIALAEKTGMILPIGEWVLRTACTQVKAWQDAGLGNLRVAVNLSARQFTEREITTVIARILEQTGLAPEHLNIEITESMVMLDTERAVDMLNELKRLGIQLSIDDFGTGYSNLSYLKRFPIDVLKIDRSFIREIPLDANDTAIADAIILMAHSLGIKVVAEGVETEPQCEFLARNMCDEIQGFLFSQALSATDIEAMLREGRSLPSHLLRSSRRARTLLLVDDEPSILSALRRQLRNSGYRILTAASGQEGLDLLAANEVDVIVSDQRMPGLTGVEFLRTVKTLYPETVRIVLSGFTELQAVTDAVNEGAIYKFLTKPWEDEQLRGHIDEAFRHKEMANENRRLNQEVRSSNQELARANRQLEEVLAQQRRQIRLGEVSLDIVREALQHVPIPVLGMDDGQMVVLANGAAQELLESRGTILGCDAANVLPELIHAVGDDMDSERRIINIGGHSLEVMSRGMGHGTQSRGRLITLLEVDAK